MIEDLDLIIVVALYTGVMLGAGAAIGAKIAALALPTIETTAYAQGAKDCEEFHRRQQARDQLQGVEKHERIN